MSKRPPTVSGASSAQRKRQDTATPAACSRRPDQQCAPVNAVIMLQPDSVISDAYRACTCGRRFGLARPVERSLRALASGYRPLRRDRDSLESKALDLLIDDKVWPADHVCKLAKQGVVPIGTPVLHAPCGPVNVLSRGMVDFG